MLGDKSNSVRNVRAARASAELRHGRDRATVRLTEGEVSDRPSILKRYLHLAPGARAHIPLDPTAPAEAFDTVAAAYPVFRIDPDPAGRPLTAVAASAGPSARPRVLAQVKSRPWLMSRPGGINGDAPAGALGGVERVERFEQRVGQAFGGGEEALVVALDLDDLWRVQPAGLAGVKGAGRERPILPTGDVGGGDLRVREARQREWLEDRRAWLSDQKRGDPSGRDLIRGVREGVAQQLVREGDRPGGR
jgi:hypothetical protein